MSSTTPTTPSSATPADHDPISVHVDGVPPHTRSQVLGLVLLAAAPSATILVALIAGLPIADAAFLLPFVAAAALGAVAAWRWGTKGRIAGLVLGLAAAGMTFWMGFGLLSPASAVEFTTGTAWLLGVVLLLWGGIGSLVRRGAPAAAHAPLSERRLNNTALALVALAALVSVPTWMLGRSTVDETATAGLPEVVAQNFSYEDVAAAAGESIVVRNSDPFHHTFTIDALGIDVELLPGSATVVTLPSTAGSFTFYCIPHSAEAGAGPDDMAATLTIE